MILLITCENRLRASLSPNLLHVDIEILRRVKADFLCSQKLLAATWQVLASSQNKFLPSHECDNLMNIGLAGLLNRGS